MIYKISGIIECVFPVQQITDKFRKKEFVLKVKREGINEMEYDYLRFQLIGEKIQFADDIVNGDRAEVHFIITGKPFEKNGETRYFNNLDCVFILKNSFKTEEEPPPKNKSVIYPNDINMSDQMIEPEEEKPEPEQEEHDDLPF